MKNLKFIKLSEYAIAVYKLLSIEGLNNVKIGGTTAMKARGLNLHKQPQDVDIVVMRPTEYQKDVVAVLSRTSEQSIRMCKSLYMSEKIKAVKLPHNVDVLVTDKVDYGVGEYLSNGSGDKILVGSIELALQAKMELKRRKDWKDIFEINILNDNKYSKFLFNECEIKSNSYLDTTSDIDGFPF